MPQQLTVYPYGEDLVTLAANGSLTLSTTGEGFYKVYRQVGYPNYPNTWSLIAQGDATASATVGPYSGGAELRIEAGSDPVYYSAGTGIAASGAAAPIVAPFFPPAQVGVVAEYFNDFFSAQGLSTDCTDTIDWDFTILEAGGGDAACALIDGVGGQVKFTNDGNDNDRIVVSKIGEAFKFTAGKKLWFRSRFLVSDADDVDAFVGLVIKTATDPAGTAPTDGTWFQLTEGSATLTLKVSKNSTATSTNVGTVSDDTFLDVAYYYDGVSGIDIYLNGTYVATSATTNLCDDEELAVFMAIQNGAAGNDYLTVDYIYAAQER
jgi:hypothetical protein